MPPVALYVSSDFARTRSSSPSCRSSSIVRSWKWPARGWIAVPAWRSTDSDGHAVVAEQHGGRQAHQAAADDQDRNVLVSHATGR